MHAATTRNKAAQGVINSVTVINTDHFSGLVEQPVDCVCVCARTLTCERNEMTFDLDIWQTA